jgi:hypothetical protein
MDSKCRLVVSLVQWTRSVQIVPTSFERLVEPVGINNLPNVDLLFEKAKTEGCASALEITCEQWRCGWAGFIRNR